MKIVINVNNLDRSRFVALWMSYTRLQIESTRSWAFRELNSNKFNSNMDTTIDLSGNDLKMQSVLTFATTRLYAKIGRINRATRNLDAFRTEYLKLIKSHWVEYYHGIHSNRLPMDIKYYSSRNDPPALRVAQLGISNTLINNDRNDFKRSALRFFEQWKGKNLTSKVKVRFRPICSPIMHGNFDKYYRALISASHGQMHLLLTDINSILIQ